MSVIGNGYSWVWGLLNMNVSEPSFNEVLASCPWNSQAVMYPPPFCVSDETLVYSKPRLMDEGGLIRYGDDE